MPSQVTIHCEPHAPVAFPPACCVCLAPATTTRPVDVWMHKARYPARLKVTARYQLPAPYCAAHGAAAARLRRYDRAAAAALLILGAALLVAAELTAGPALRDLGAAAWWGATVLAIALLALAGAVIHQLGRRLIQRPHLAPAAHLADGALAVATAAQVARHATPASAPTLALTLTFANDEFAAQFAAQHGAEARPRSDGL